ncbi:hypothetical protein P3T36_006348 [Kitasatospora sp. MAP12-15]|uniref:hypothetical protein n=1 Tax=unclassified Kitasatospora TaxID=2633591 RepID=UPI002473F7DA|nr:hypothetical protein [Kitasatospora sp. MAP12-44]MDH6107889.1 hypothetical protein [Kitasatospora sp. MAP12-44]
MATTTQSPAPTARRVPGHEIQRKKRRERGWHLAAAAAVAAGPQLYASGYAELGAVGALTATGLWLYSKSKPDAETGDLDHVGLLRSSQRAVPALGYSAAYLADVVQQLHGGFAWWQLAAPAAWGALMAWAAPITHSKGLVPEALPQPAPAGPDGAPSAPPGDYPGFLAWLWSTSERTANTRLVAVEHYLPGRPDFEAVIVAQRGREVPNLSEAALAAVFDFPVGSVQLRPVRGSGPGRMRLIARPTLTEIPQDAADFPEFWEERISGPGGAAPGVALVRHREEDDRIVVQVQAPIGKEIHLPHGKVCSALGIDDVSRLVIETDGVRNGLVSIYQRNPLMKVRKATPEDLTMDSKGRIAIGVRHDGKPSKVRLWDPQLGAIRGITAGATGAGKSVLQLLLLVGEKLSGVISWVGDLQGGKSLPEAEGHVDWFAKGETETLGMLLAAHAVMKYRERESRERGDFALGRPWRLLSITLDEINRLLSHPNEIIKALAAYLIADIQKTGRKVGVGVRLAVQSLHLKDLGDEEAIRQQGKSGMVVLMRTLSSSTQAMGLDGIAPLGFQMENIPARIYETGQIEALFDGEDDDDGESTAGMAYIFTDGRAEFMRTFTAQKEDGLYVDLIELFGDDEPPTLTPGEAAAATEAYAWRHDHEQLAVVLQALLALNGITEAPGDGAMIAALAKAKGGAKKKAGGEAKDSLPDRVYELLAQGPMSLKELRAALPDVKNPTSVSNAATALRDRGLAKPVSRGVWQRIERDDTDDTDYDDSDDSDY